MEEKQQRGRKFMYIEVPVFKTERLLTNGQQKQNFGMHYHQFLVADADVFHHVRTLALSLIFAAIILV